MNTVTVTRVSFGFPINVTQEIDINEIDLIKKTDFSNKNVTLKVILDKALKKNFNQKALEEEIKIATNAHNIRIQFQYNRDESLRSQEVANSVTVIDKFKKYAELTELKYKDSVLTKIEEIQDNMLINNFVPSESFELEYFSLRGAIGIKDGQGKDEISFNFKDDFSEGIIGLCGDNGKGKCVTGDTYILGNKGFEKISKHCLPKKYGYKPFEKELYTKKGCKASSSHFYTEKVNETIKITNSLGMSLEGTPDHPVLVFNKDCKYEFKKLKDLQTGEYVCVPRGMNVFASEDKPFNKYIEPKSRNAIKKELPKKMTIELAKFLGYYIGNGTVDTNAIQFCSKNQEILKDYENCVKSIFDVNIHVTKKKDAYNYVFTSNCIIKFLKSMLGYPIKNARLKHIPTAILESTKDCQKAFLTAYFDCDTSICKNVFELCTASESIAKVIQNMLLNFGVISIHRTKKVKGFNWTYHIINVCSSDIDILMDEILDKSIKYKNFTPLTRNTNIDIIPYLKEFTLKFFPVKKNGKIYDEDKVYFSPYTKTSAKNLTYKVLNTIINNSLKIKSNRCLEYAKIVKPILDNNYFYSPIKNIVHNTSQKDVFDYTIPSTHQFYSNGYISHNTTLIENMHPFPQMLTRSGALKEHFCLKDSHRILIYKMSNGKRIRISMLIDGCAKNVMTKYIVEYQDEGSETWVPDTSIDGGFDSYKKFCENKFGSVQLFMRTSFFANKEIKKVPDLSNATTSEKMELFSTLAGTDYLSEISKQAKDLANKEDKIITEIKGQLENYDNIEQRQEEISASIVDDSQQLDSYKKLIEIDNQELALYNEEQKKYLAAAGAYDIVRMTLNEKRSTNENNIRLLSTVKNQIEALDEVLIDEQLYIEQIAWYDDNTKKLKELHKQSSVLQDKKSLKQAELDKIELENDSHKNIINDMSVKIDRLKTENEFLTKSIPDLNGVCPVCGAPLSEHKKEELKKEVSEIETKLKNNNENIEKYELTIKSERELIVDTTSIEKEISDTDDEILETINTITKINDYMDSIDIDKAKDVINNYPAKKEEYLNKQKSIEEEQIQLLKDIEELESKMNNVPEDYSDKIERLERGIKDSQQQIATLTADINSLRREKDNLDHYADKVKEIKSQIKEHQQNVKDYTIIKDAFGNNGIQAIELDSAAPEISDITNSILSETYGDRFTVSFDTQRDAKDGHKINDFVINVFDSKSGRTKTLDLLSSGEGIWIKQAMYYAFSVIRSRRTGFCFKTRFLDESDGALDSDARVKYLKMIEMAHKLCNATQTILITHSQEIKDLFDQKIEL